MQECRPHTLKQLQPTNSRVRGNTSRSARPQASVWPLTIINAVHVYHMVGGFRLTGADYFHHLVFIPTLGFPGQIFRWGPLANWLAFFISGLPGGVDYLLLGLIKIGRVHHMLEKRVNANLNSWVRAPGILFATCLLYQALVYGHYIVPLWAIALQLVLPAYNVAHDAGASVSPLRGALDAVMLHCRRCTSISRPSPTMPYTTCSTCSARLRSPPRPDPDLRSLTHV